MINRIKRIISAVESLGLDTQPLRDLMESPEVDYSQYESRMTNLEREVFLHPPGSQPQQVQIMVKHMRPVPKEATFKSRNINITADNYVIQKQESSGVDPALADVINKMNSLVEKLSSQEGKQIPTSQDQGSAEVLEKLAALADKVENMKISSSPLPDTVDPNMPKISEAFVNPLDEDEVKKISGNIHVAPKKGKSLASSLKKLRGLKK